MSQGLGSTEDLYNVFGGYLLTIAQREMSRRGRALMDAQDIVHEAFARGFIDRWCASFDPDRCIKDSATFEFDCSKLPDTFRADQVARARAEAEAKHNASKKLTGLKFWLGYKFAYFVGDELRRKVQSPTLHLDYNRGKEGKATKVSAISLEPNVDVARESIAVNVDEYLEGLDELQSEVLKRFYILDQTLAEISQDLCCHPNTIHSIKKQALERVRKNFRI